MKVNQWIKKIMLSVLLMCLGLSMVGCKQESLNGAEVILKLLDYNQDKALPQMIQAMASSDSQALEQFYEAMDKDVKDMFSEYFIAEALDDYLLKYQPELLKNLLGYTLPLQIDEPHVQEGDSQIITFSLKDAHQEEGELTFQVQYKDNKISYIKYMV